MTLVYSALLYKLHNFRCRFVKSAPEIPPGNVYFGVADPTRLVAEVFNVSRAKSLVASRHRSIFHVVALLKSRDFDNVKFPGASFSYPNFEEEYVQVFGRIRRVMATLDREVR